MTDRTPYDPLPTEPGFRAPVVADATAASVWERTDALMDRVWFRLNPGETSRTRPATHIERAAYGLPDGASVVAVRAGGDVSWAFVVTIPRPESAPPGPPAPSPETRTGGPKR